jgi:hypothetical protein
VVAFDDDVPANLFEGFLVEVLKWAVPELGWKEEGGWGEEVAEVRLGIVFKVKVEEGGGEIDKLPAGFFELKGLLGD